MALPLYSLGVTSQVELRLHLRSSIAPPQALERPSHKNAARPARRRLAPLSASSSPRQLPLEPACVGPGRPRLAGATPEMPRMP